MIKLSNTLSDVTYKTANNFTKLGHAEGADILNKIAQEVPEGPPVVAPEAEEGAVPAQPVEEVIPQEVPAEPINAPEEGVADEDEGPTKGIPRSGDVEPVAFEDIAQIPGARQGEYEELAGEIRLDDAANKLDEVAGMLADRRIIRQLAEFDIMLDKIGIASMFPELAESQSKLIDAFSYALTRVTKMMGQLANAKTLVEAQSGIPGADDQAEEPAAEEAPPSPMEEGGLEEAPLPPAGEGEIGPQA
jgi:hypothetical protein